MTENDSKKILVTGGTGFVGSHLVHALIKRGYEVICLVREKSDTRCLKNLKLKLTLGDITKKDSLKEAVKNIDYVYHLAGITKSKNIKTYYIVNSLGTKNLIEACEEINPKLKKFLYMSSLAAAGPGLMGISVKEDDTCRPISDYGKSKLKGEELLEKYNQKIPITIVRPCAIYGPGDKDTLHFFKCVRKGIIPLLGGRKRYIKLCHVSDIINGCILAAESKYSSEKFFLAGDSIHTWEEIGEIMTKVFGKRGMQLLIPYPLLKFSASISEMFSGLFKTEPAFNRQKLLEMKQDWICDIKKAKELLGYAPIITLKNGINETASWYIKNRWL
ncbi:MAG: NAD-dependent epimerase/dehydratase family protein [Thermodesulfobacteriota bacterium]|nr:NAD-dependent epimerase/dehydratase family protein [Thermodesulfobacteriota bacterium]